MSVEAASAAELTPSSSRNVWHLLRWEDYSAFVAGFREAAEKLKRGEWPVRFPLGSFPPALPFVSAYAAQPP